MSSRHAGQTTSAVDGIAVVHVARVTQLTRRRSCGLGACAEPLRPLKFIASKHGYGDNGPIWLHWLALYRDNKKPRRRVKSAGAKLRSLGSAFALTATRQSPRLDWITSVTGARAASTTSVTPQKGHPSICRLHRRAARSWSRSLDQRVSLAPCMSVFRSRPCMPRYRGRVLYRRRIFHCPSWSCCFEQSPCRQKKRSSLQVWFPPMKHC